MTVLQWGRGHVTAESPGPRAALEAYGWLQWGRGHVTAESYGWELVSSAPDPGFNGAAVM